MIFSKVKLAIAVIFSLLLFNNVRLAKKVNDLDKQVGIAMNNAQVWENIANQNRNEARLLELTVNDFKNSNDSLIKVARDQQKKLNIKDKQLRQVASTETVIRDTTVRIIPSKEKDFCVELKPNQLTTITVARKDSVFTHTMEILNHQDLFVYEVILNGIRTKIAIDECYNKFMAANYDIFEYVNYEEKRKMFKHTLYGL